MSGPAGTPGGQAPARPHAFPITTHRRHVPWHWMVLMTIPTLTGGYIEFCSGAPLTFTVKKFTGDPLLINFIISINTLFNFLVGVVAGYTSDHIWTRWGRRRVFLIPGWIVLAVCLALIPGAPSLLWLIVLVVIYQFSQDFGACTVQPLNMEVIPPPQRGTFQRNLMIAGGLAGLFYNLVLLAQFDRVHQFTLPLGPLGDWDIRLTGEQVVYWTGSLFIACVVVFLALCIREVRPPHPPEIKRFSVVTFLKDAYGTRQFQYLLLLCLGVTIAGAGLATNTVLLFTAQFGYTKMQFGQVMAINSALSICLFAPLFGWIADRVPRLVMTKIGIIGVWMTQIVYFFYIKLLAPEGIPPLPMVIAMSVLTAAFFSCYLLSHAPNVGDYLESNQFGTWGAALTLPNGMLLFLLPNLYGAWVRWHGRTFLPEGQFDYSMAYVLNFFLGIAGISMIFAFGRAVKAGRIRPRGKMEWDESRNP